MPDLISNYAILSFKTFGGLSKTIRPYFVDIQQDLQKGSIKYTLEEYLSMAIFTVFITFFIEAISFAFIFGLLGFSPVVAAFLGFTLSITLSGFVFFLFYARSV